MAGWIRRMNPHLRRLEAPERDSFLDPKRGGLPRRFISFDRVPIDRMWGFSAFQWVLSSLHLDGIRLPNAGAPDSRGCACYSVRGVDLVRCACQ